MLGVGKKEAVAHAETLQLGVAAVLRHRAARDPCDREEGWVLRLRVEGRPRRVLTPKFLPERRDLVDFEDGDVVSSGVGVYKREEAERERERSARVITMSEQQTVRSRMRECSESTRETTHSSRSPMFPS